MRLLKLELVRKSIHFIGVGYIPLYLYAGKEITLIAVLALTLFAAILEILKLKFDVIPHFLLRDYELRGIGSYLYTGASVSLITVVLPMEACFAGIANGIVGDGVSGLAKMYKSWISAPIMFISSFLTLFVVSYFAFVDLNYYAVVLSCAGGVAADRFPRVGGRYINDNFSIPLVSAVLYGLGLMVFV